MTKVFNFFKLIPRPFLWSILSGILVGTSYIPFPGWALFFCYIPLWYTCLQNIEQKNYKTLFFYGWISQFILTIIGFNWIFYVSSEFGYLHWTISLAALLLFASLMHVYIPLSLVFTAWLCRQFQIKSTFSRLMLFPLTLSLFERVWPGIFEWNLGYTLLWNQFSLAQWADTVGFWGLSTWILLAQAILLYACLVIKTQKKMGLSLIFTLVFSLAALNFLGTYKKSFWQKTDQIVQFGIAQGNIGNAEKIQSEKGTEYHSYILGIYSELTDQHLKTHPETEVMLWPETALPFALDPYFHNRIEPRKLLNIVHAWDIPLVTGGYSVNMNVKDHLGYPLTSNAVFFISPEQKLMADTYRKSELLVFGEYMPLGEQIPFLYKLLPFVGIFEKGPGPVVKDISLKNKNIKLGPQICYESLDSAFSRELATKGSQIIFNVTNDSWFGWWAEPFQHQYMTLARALEVRRPLVRSTNTGISSVVLASGEILENSPIREKWVHTYAVPYKENPEQSFYTLYGHFDYLIWLLALVLLIYFSKNKGNHVRR